MKEKMILSAPNNKNHLVKILFTGFLLLSFLKAYSQGEANIWYFGVGAGLNFNGGGAPTLLTNGAINNSGIEGEGCSAISDAFGNLLFYTDGVTIYNKNHVAMTNGTGLTGNKSGTQTAIIAPVPGSTSQYYVFTSPVTNGTNQIRYNIVDMTLSGGLGEVTATKNVIMPSCPTYMMEALTCVPTDVPGEYWVIGHGAANAGSSNSTNQFYAWEITSGGVSATPVVSSVGYNLPSSFVSGAWVSAGQGFLKSNTCYTKIFSSFFAQGAAGSVEMHNFDKATGVVSGPTIAITNFDNPFEVYSIEISPNDRYLYVSELGQTSSAAGDERVHQFDLSSGVAATIDASRNTLMSAAPGSFTRTGHLQLAPNGKIYVSHHTFSGVDGQLGVINDPDLAACNYQNAPAALNYPSGGTTHGLPQFPRNFVAAVLGIDGTPTACLDAVPEVSIPLNFTFSGNASNITWSTSGGGTFSPNATDNSPTVTYTTPGTKTVTLQITDNCSNVNVETYDIIVAEKVYSAGTVSCYPTLGTVTAPDGAYTYVWYAEPTGDNPIATGTTNVPLTLPPTGTVYLAAQMATSTTNYSLTNGPAGFPNSNASASVTMRFTLTKPITFNTFRWASALSAWSGSNVTAPYTISINDVPSANTYYTRTQNVAIKGPAGANAATTYTENVNTILPAGTYEIAISGVGGMIRRSSTCPNNTTDAQGALSYNTLSGNCIATAFTYDLTDIVVTTQVNCSQRVAIPYGCPLPVEFLSFAVIRSGENALLKWSTANENNNNYFEIEKSSDGIHFHTIGTVKGAGNSNSLLTYTYVDLDIQEGIIYYRIKQVDYDAAFGYSPIRYINVVSALSFSVSPNPGNGEFDILLNSGNIGEQYDIEVLNLLGEVVLAEEKYNTDNRIKMNLKYLAKGVYLVRVIGEDSNYMSKVVIE